MNTLPIQLSVGIPAYNESNNTAGLVKSVLSQVGDSFVLREIIVISDGSSDDTVAKARSVHDPRLNVVDSKDRKGKAGRCNELFDMFTTDVLIQFDADMRLLHTNVIEEMVKVMKVGGYGFVCGNLVPLDPKSYVEKLANFGIAAWTDILNELGPEKSMLHHCVGGARLFTRGTLRDFRFPSEVEMGEDVYTYFTLLKQGVRIGYAPAAVVNYRLASTFKDYVKQMHRFLTTTDTMSNQFGHNVYEREDLITTRLKLKAFIRRALKTNPIIPIGYACLQLYARLTVWKYKRTKLWDIASSTK